MLRSNPPMDLHHDAIVIDLHADTVLPMRTIGYRFEKRHRWPLVQRLGFAHVDHPRLVEGGVTAQFLGMGTVPFPERGCAASCLRQHERLRRAAEATGMIWARTAEDVRRAKREGKVAAFTGIEGGHNLEGDPDNVERFHEAGVRYLGLAHLTSNAAAPTSTWMVGDDARPLSELGREVVTRMQRLGMIVDLAHVGKRAFHDVVKIATRPVIVSHTGIAGAYPLWRNVDDEQLKAVASTDGVVGIIFAWRYLGRRRGGVEMLAPHLEHVRKTVGARHLALGSDFDGSVAPLRGLEGVDRIPFVTRLVQSMGWGDEEILGLLGGNMLRVLEGNPPA